MPRARVLSTLVLTALLSLFVVPSASAATVNFTVGDYTYTADDTDASAGAVITGYDSIAGGPDPVIPTNVTDPAPGGLNYSVTTIEDNAFYNNRLTSVTIGNNVTTIGAYAFGVNLLTSVTIPNSVTAIGDDAFRSNSLTSVTIGDSVTTIGDNAFALNSLANVTIPNSVTTIKDFAFYKNLLTSVTIGNSVSAIGRAAFAGNGGLVDVKFLGNEPPGIRSYTFDNTGGASDLLVSYYGRFSGSGFTSPIWFAGSVTYRSQALATVTFVAQGNGTAPAPVDVVVWGSVTDPGVLTAPGYAFGGWFTAASGGTAVTFPYTVTADTTLYAQWSDTPATITTPATFTPWAVFAVTGDNFTPGEYVEIWLLSTPVKLASTTAASDGTISVPVTIPETVAAGPHHIEARATSDTVSNAITVQVALAETGADNAGLAGFAALLLLLGGALLATSRHVHTR